MDSELVLVPLQNGTTIFSSIDDLDVSYWIQPGLQIANVQNHAASRLRVDVFPSTTDVLPDPFTIYYQAQSQCSRRNHIMDVLLTGQRMWKGTILVVKHGGRLPVTDMTRSDGPNVKCIVVA
jgi:hypothetical protein